MAPFSLSQSPVSAGWAELERQERLAAAPASGAERDTGFTTIAIGSGERRGDTLSLVNLGQ